ncbi:MAG: hypothetical protein M0037_04705 [Betaproteobacteria bacterium]|nr:hypothetical protein [Betaproteobacteria bacterium]
MGQAPYDQAEGLRRLLARGETRIIVFASGCKGSGQTSAILNLGAALSRGGRHVVVLDEAGGRLSLSHALGVDRSRDLVSLARREHALHELLEEHADILRVIPVAHGLRGLSELSSEAVERLAQSLASSPRPIDVLMVDARPGSGVVPICLAAPEVVVVVSNSRSSIKEAYALIKVLSQEYGRHRFHLLVTRAEPGDGETIFANMVEATSRFLQVSLDFMGWVAPDEKVAQSVRTGRTVVEAWPASDCAKAFRGLADVIERWPYPREEEGRMDVFVRRLVYSSRIAAKELSSAST